MLAEGVDSRLPALKSRRRPRSATRLLVDIAFLPPVGGASQTSFFVSFTDLKVIDCRAAFLLTLYYDFTVGRQGRRRRVSGLHSVYVVIRACVSTMMMMFSFSACALQSGVCSAGEKVDDSCSSFWVLLLCRHEGFSVFITILWVTGCCLWSLFCLVLSVQICPVSCCIPQLSTHMIVVV